MYQTKNTLIASRPGVGKTQFAIDYYNEKIRNNTNGIFISLEMSVDQLFKRLVESNKDNTNIENLDFENLYITSEMRTFNEVVEYIESIHDNIKFVIIDYFQLLDNNFEFDKLMEYLQYRNISLLMTTQIRRFEEAEGEVVTDLILHIREQYILPFFDEVKFITNKYGVVNLSDTSFKM